MPCPPHPMLATPQAASPERTPRKDWSPGAQRLRRERKSGAKRSPSRRAVSQAHTPSTAEKCEAPSAAQWTEQVEIAPVGP